MRKLRWFRYNIKHFWHESLPAWIADHLPKKIAYWATIRLGVHASTGKYSNQIVPEMYFVDVLERWEKNE